MKTFFLALLTAPLIMLLSGCGNSEAATVSDDGRIVVEFWHAMGRNHGKTLNELASEFNESQSKYRILPVYQGRYDSLSQKLIASLYANRNPAMAQTYPSWTKRFYGYGYMEPVQTFIDQDPEFQEQLDDFFPVMLAENTMKNPETSEKKLVTLPFNKSVYVLYVNQTKLEEKGLKPPKTWDEFYEVARAMTERPAEDQQPTMFGFATRPYIEDLTVMAMTTDTQLLDEETGDINFTTGRVVDAFEFLKQLTTGTDNSKIGYVETSYLSNVFGSERVAMYISSTAAMPYNDMAVGDKFIWRAHPVPSFDEDTVGKTLMQGTNMGIFKNVPEEEQQGAWEFMKFLCQPESTAKWASNTGYMPVRRSAKEIPWFREELENDISYANAISTLETAAYEPRLIYWESVRSLISRQVEAVLLGRKTVDQALQEAKEAVEEIQSEAS